MKVSEILEEKGPRVLTVGPEAMLVQAAQMLFENRIGSLVVLDANGNVVGILTERDIVHQLARLGGEVGAERVRDAMTADVVTAWPEQDVEEARRVMTERHIRHMPVVENGALRGIISIGDVLKVLRDACEVDRRDLSDYISGKYLNS